MKKAMFAVILFAAVLLASCKNTADSGDDFEPLPEGVYIAGEFLGPALDGNDSLSQACYWTGSRRIVLGGSKPTLFSSSFSISVKDSKVLVTGVYFIRDEVSLKLKKINCYWVNGKRHDSEEEFVPPDSEVKLPPGIDRPEGSVFGYTVARGKVWIVGHYSNEQENYQACYWLDGERHDLNGGTATAIFVEEE